MSKSKILVLDIETLPALSFHFRMWDENFGPKQFRKVSRTYSVGAKWSGDPAKDTMYFEAPTEADREDMLTNIYLMMREADAIVTYNGDKFDLRRLEGEFAEFGLAPLGKLTSIDVLKTVRTFGLPSNKLEYALVYFKCGKKIETEGMPLWIDVFDGKVGARKKMATYCKGDVIGLDRLYIKLRNRISNHPDLSHGAGCPVCSHPKHSVVGVRYTKLYAIDKNRCYKCSHVYDGKRNRVRR